MEPLKVEISALREVLMTPLETFVTDRERDEKGEEWAEKMAHQRMFASAIKAVDKARGDRTLHMVVLRFGRGDNTFYTAFGPYATNAQAVKATVGLAQTFEYTAVAVVPMRNAEGLAALVTELNAKPEGRGDWVTVAGDARLHRKGWKGNRKDRAKYEAMA